MDTEKDLIIKQINKALLRELAYFEKALLHALCIKPFSDTNIATSALITRSYCLSWLLYFLKSISYTNYHQRKNLFKASDYEIEARAWLVK